MTPLQSLNDDLASHIGEMRIVMDEMGGALKAMLAPAPNHHSGCLWLNDRRMPCQCGFHDRLNSAQASAIGSARSALSSYERVRKKVCSETTGDAS